MSESEGTSPDRHRGGVEHERHERFDYGVWSVKATFSIVDGVELSRPSRVYVTSPDTVISLGGSNALVKGHLIAEVLAMNPIID